MIDSAKSASRVTRLKVDKGGKNFIALFALISVGFSGLTLLLQIVVLGSVISIAKKPAPSLVQLNDGQSIAVNAIGSNDRSLKTVQSFTTDALSMLMSWTNELPVVKGEASILDQGSLVKTKDGDKRITTSTFQTSFLLSDDLRDEVVKILADMTPADVFKGDVKTTLKMQHVTMPVQIDSGKWKVDIVATLIQYRRGRGDTIQVPFNKEIIVRAVDTPPLPKDGKIANEIDAVVNSIRRAGLEITSMKDIEAKDAAPVSSPAPNKLQKAPTPQSGQASGQPASPENSGKSFIKPSTNQVPQPANQSTQTPEKK